MQTQSDASTDSPFPTTAFSASGLFAGTDHLAWCRRDWRGPVGTFDCLVEERHREVLEGEHYLWTLHKIPRLTLSHTAALFLLQGMQLKHLLLSNYFVRRCNVPDLEFDMGDVLLRVDPWDYRRAVPVLTNLSLVFFHGEPEEVVKRLLLPAVIAATAS